MPYAWVLKIGSIWSRYKTYIEKAQIENRTFYPLENAFLPEETPLDRKELWFDGKINHPIKP